MPSSYAAVYVHAVFGTSGHKPILPKQVWEPLSSYLATVAASRQAKPVLIAAVADHVHMLIGLPRDQAIKDLMRDLKANSSRWLHETYPELTGVRWQDGYSIFGVSVRGLGQVCNYIRNQEEHHRHKSFREELKGFLDAHGIDYDERYL